MKHPISILQSRIAKRSRLISEAMLPLYESPRLLGYSRCIKIRDGLSPNHPKIVYLAKQQKEDKKILAALIRLQREVRWMNSVFADINDILTEMIADVDKEMESR